MTYPKEDFKKFFLPVYFVWAIINPILLMAPTAFYGVFSNFSWNALIRFISFYMIFGGIWPLTIITYPAFLASTKINGDSIFLIYGALTGPILTLLLQAFRHKKYVEERKGKKISVSDYLWDFI